MYFRSPPLVRPHKLEAILPLPSRGASRLTSFSGKCRFYFTEETYTANFVLPLDGSDIEKPEERGPVTLLSLRRLRDSVKAVWTVDVSGFPNNMHVWLRRMSYEMQDANGRPMRVLHKRYRTEKTEYRYEVTFSTEDRVPASLVVTCPRKFYEKDITFKFRDVGLSYQRVVKFSSEEEIF